MLKDDQIISVPRLGTPTPSKTDEFSEKFQTALFWCTILYYINLKKEGKYLSFAKEEACGKTESNKTWWACLWVVGGGRWGRHLLTTPASNQLQPHTTTTTLLLPSCFPEVKLNSKMQQLVAFCIFGGFGLCCAVAELSRLFLKKNLTSYLSSPSMISIPSTNIPILKLFESLSLQAALYGLLEQGGGEGHRP